jgi:hypothetical protein
MEESNSFCCPPGAEPFKEEDPNYKPKGSIETFHGVEAYVTVNDSVRADNQSDKRLCLIYIHDLFGLNSGNNNNIKY